jgi:hypothetical protein
MRASALIFNYLHVVFALQYWQTTGTADARESMTLNGQVLVVASVAIKAAYFQMRTLTLHSFQQ